MEAPMQSSASGSKPMVKVHVWSDVACPWCWVGWCRLQQAVEGMQQEAEFDVSWHAFLLDPLLAPGAEDINSYYHKLFGQAPALRQRLHDSGKWDGAPFADWRWRPNTLEAHELIALAARYGRSHDASGLLFRKNYEEGANLAERDQLLSAAQQLGLPAAEVEGWLGSKEAEDAVMRDDEEAKSRRGIKSVPTFLISCGSSKELELVGAESVKAFEVAFRKVMHEARGTPPEAVGRHASPRCMAAGPAKAKQGMGMVGEQPRPAGPAGAAEE